ncbi:MAG: CRISPR-associated protein Cas4 [Acidobacteriota bacterium]
MEEISYLPLSALNHFSYCPRRCYLIHCEGIFAENAFTLEGRLLHNRTDSGVSTVRDGIKEYRHVHLISHRLRLRGIADLIEEKDGCFRPIEYKRGRRGKWENDEIQVCAQALCLEEMLQLSALSEGAIYYAQTGRRKVVPLTNALRNETESAVAAIWQMLESRLDPGAEFTPKCNGCSLYQVCLPAETARLRKLTLEQLFAGDEE